MAKIELNGGSYDTLAAGRMIQALDVAWDSITPYQATHEAGELAEVDADALRDICGETGDDFDVAHAEVMRLIRSQLAVAGVL